MSVTAKRRPLPRRVMAAARRVPVAAWLCALVAGLSALTWSLVTPPFHVPDEVSHFAYAQYLAETGELPRENNDLSYSPEQQTVLHLTDFYLVIGEARGRPPWTRAQDRALDDAPAGDPVSTGNAQSATNNPPLYYLLQAVPYHLAASLDLPDRLMFMRLLSVLMAAVTALATFLFVREALPSTPWAWTAGGLVAAFQPLFGFISSGVQNDAMLYMSSALLFLALARAFRHGLTPRRGAAIGAAASLGLLSKLTFIGLIPGALLAVALLAWRGRDAHDRRTVQKGAVVATAIVATVGLLYIGANVALFDRPALPGAIGTTGSSSAAAPTDAAPGDAAPAEQSGGMRERVAYIWQLYLPRLPFMSEQFPGANPMPNLWLHGWIGRFGWLDASWPDAVYRWGRWLLVLLGALAVFATGRRLRRDSAWRERWPELVSYAGVALGLLVIIGLGGYRARETGQPGFEQARYLLPLLPLYAAAVGMALRPFGRWAPAAAAALVVAAFGHNVLAQLLTISRFYG
jgi:4-amino-4-deoxy-L-arabinose transferase-like glycosyltransferase